MRRSHRSRHTRGFTLVELVIVIVLLGVMAPGVAVSHVPAVQGYIGTRSRAELAAQAAHALRRMARDVQSAVPNSIRTPDASCVELVPTASGGRFRRGPDTVNDAAPGCAPAADCAAPLDLAQAGLEREPLFHPWVVGADEADKTLVEEVASEEVGALVEGLDAASG